MQENPITCPQCGLMNNSLAEACAQCGIIFVKNSAVAVPNMQDEQKRRAIEEAEAILDKSGPTAESEVIHHDNSMRPDPAEDTVEMAIPIQPQASEIKTGVSTPQGPKPEENPDPGTQEIELEAIEAAVENVTDATDAETLFLSEVNPEKTVEPANSEVHEKPAEAPADQEAAVAKSDETIRSETVKEASEDPKPDNRVGKPSDAGPGDETHAAESRKVNESEKAPSVTAEPVQAGGHSEPDAGQANIGDKPADTVQTVEQEIHLEEKPDLTAVKDKAVEAEVRAYAHATIEMPAELAAENEHANKPEVGDPQEALKKQQEAKVLEALKRQRENQAKAEALNKEKAARAKAVALKKKKLARIKAEALKKQKAAQAKAEVLKKKKQAQAQELASDEQKKNLAGAEVLKKQKQAQTQAEASAREIQVAGIGAHDTVSQTTGNRLSHHVRLLGLLKRYKGRAIGINYDNSTEIKEAELVDANEEFFSVMVKDKKLHYSYPLKTILSIVEGQEGVETGEDNKKFKFNAVIKVYPLVS
jgi:hypothetical protein